VTLKTLLVLVFLAPFGVLAGEVVDVTSRGEITRLLVEQGDDPWVVAVLFAGAHGVMNISAGGSIGRLGGNFLVRARRHFHNRGAITAIIDAPTDHTVDLTGFRASAEHAADVGAAIAHLRSKYALPVWLIGTSRGTNSAANAAIRLGPEGPDGIVLTTSLLRANTRGTNVLSMELERIALPVLVVHHTQDACRYTPPGKVADLMQALTRAQPAKVLLYEGGRGIRGQACRAFHYHGYAGIEERVVADIMAWIAAPAR
jgi:hypothetical protein